MRLLLQHGALVVSERQGTALKRIYICVCNSYRVSSTFHTLGSEPFHNWSCRPGYRELIVEELFISECTM
jgi:hypothetical protein